MKKQYTFHLLCTVHTPQSKVFMSDAFVQKNRKMAKMLTSMGHTVYAYCSEGSDIEEYCKGEPGKLIQVITHTLEDIQKDYGDGNNLPECDGIGYLWREQEFRHDFNSEKKPSTLKYYMRCIEYINKIKKPDDILLCTQGKYHKPIADGVKLYLNVESGIGYRGTVKPEEIPYGVWSRVFESAYIKYFTYGSDFPYASRDGNHYDRTIGNYFDPKDFDYSEKKDDYFLFIGRMIRRKGVQIAYQATKITGDKLIFIGQSAKILPDGSLTDTEPSEYIIPHDSNWEYRGYADLATRRKLLANAKAVFTPTLYLECFAGTHVESMLSGTPVITTNFGVFETTIPNQLNGKIGFKCDTLQDFVDAIKKVKKFGPKDYRLIRKNAEMYLMDNIKLEYQKLWNELHNVWESSVDDTKKGWNRVDTKRY